MDVVFHASSAVLLARALRERRAGWLWAAAGIGLLPDLVALAGRLAGARAYPLAHSLTLHLPIAGLLAVVHARVALGGLLHIGVDAFTHLYGGAYLAWPFARWSWPAGLTWYRWPGRALWAALWGALILCAMAEARRHRPERPARA